MALIKKGKRPSSLIVTQSNHLVEARYNLSLGEQRLILVMIAQIQPSDEDFKPYQIGIADLAEFLGISKNSMYRECKKITKRLLTRVVEINEKDGLLQTGWVSSAKYVDGSGVVNLAFDPLLKPYLLQLKGNFTSCKFEVLLSFKSQYTIRMYGILSKYKNLTVREIGLSTLREILGLSDDLHSEYSDFKRNILKTVQKELKEKSDLYFEFEEIKHSRKVDAIRFTIVVNKSSALTIENNLLTNGQFTKQVFDVTDKGNCLRQEQSDTCEPLFPELYALVLDQHKTKKNVIAAIDGYAKKVGAEYVKRNILYSNAKADKSYAGFLSNALKLDWGHDWQNDQQEQDNKSQKIRMEPWQRQGFESMKAYDEFMYAKQMQSYGAS